MRANQKIPKIEHYEALQSQLLEHLKLSKELLIQILPYFKIGYSLKETRNSISEIYQIVYKPELWEDAISNKLNDRFGTKDLTKIFLKHENIGKQKKPVLKDGFRIPLKEVPMKSPPIRESGP